MARAPILTAVVLIILALFVRHEEAALQADGVVATATVLSASENRDAVVLIGGVAMPAPTYEITVGFLDNTGRSHTKVFRTSEKIHTTGDRVRVIYDQEKPILAKLLTSDNDAPEWDRTSTFLFALAALATLMALANRIPR